MNTVIGRSDDLVIWENRDISQKQILSWFEVYGCGWVYSGEPRADQAHAKLRSEKCSNAYFDCRKLFELWPRGCAILGHQLARKIKNAGLVGEFDWIVSSSNSAITFGHHVAVSLGSVASGFTQKDPEDKDNNKAQIWTRKMPKKARVLQVEELSTTIDTPKEVRRAVVQGQGPDDTVAFLPTIAMLIHRPAELPISYGDWNIISLVELVVWSDTPDKCPYCKVGSKPVEPKANWAELTGEA